jgi:transposase
MSPAHFDLTPAQRRALRRLLRHPPSTHAYQRALALLALDRGEPRVAVAERLSVRRQSVYNWATAFRQEPAAQALLGHYGGGRPTAWTGALRSLLTRALRTTPERAGLAAGPHWTVPLLRAYLEHQGGARLAEDTIRRELQRLGYVWKRYRYVLPADPAAGKKTADPQPPAAVTAAQRRPV